MNAPSFSFTAFELLSLPLADKIIHPVDFAKRFGQNLSRCRRRADISQEELAALASLHRTAVGQLERGERVARTDTLVQLAGSMEIAPEELLDGLEWTPGEMRPGELRVRIDD